ncbi:hypothetical protein [Streptomyces sp. NPDC058745]|uniref:glycoside hydrolase family 38 N-terminal domain-containing protein n=1 Tax=Streptomyces sp. NPDC058745 TaxID=3346621 RepID=UPI0036818CEF
MGPFPQPEGISGRTSTCHVVTHVHWDREWYRPFEAFRARLVELAEQICTELDHHRIGAFHLDGQTIVLADIAALRPDLADRLTAHARAGRLTMGPWHVLADNQLVSGENLIRNLLAARRWAAHSSLAGVGYSPDAFGHPADLPRILNGFGMDTALVWRGAPPQHARFRWRSPDGSEVFAVNQGYHEAEVLWPSLAQGDEDQRLSDFLTTEIKRLPDGPWLLMNGGDHLAPTDTAQNIHRADDQAAKHAVRLRESTLEDFFTAARAAAPDDLPVVTGELRAPGDRLTFILPGTLSARTYLKQANSAAQTLLERWAEPLVALHAPDDDTLRSELRHAWELLLRNAPHDSICGCSVDEVHRENAVRFDRVQEVGEHVINRALAASGIDTRLHGALPDRHAALAVVNPHAAPHTGPVTLDLLTAPGVFPSRLLDDAGFALTFESSPLGPETHFEADLDLLPDSQPAMRHRIRFLARDVPGLGRAVYTVDLAPEPSAAHAPQIDEDAHTLHTSTGHRLTAASDASLTLTLPDGTTLPGFGRLVDGGDRGDTYNYDPPAADQLISPVLRAARCVDSAVRSTLEIDAVLHIPTALTEDRAARDRTDTSVPLTLSVTSWHGYTPGTLDWDLRFDNTADDHRLRIHFPALEQATTWLADGHFSLIDRPVTDDLGPLPQLPGHEAVCGSAPVQSVAAIGSGTARIAVSAPGLPEVRAVTGGAGNPELVVTLLRAVGWLSRFDLTSRTTGAGPMLATPEAQCRGPQHFAFSTSVGRAVADDLDLAGFAAATRAPMRAWQLRPGTQGTPAGRAPRIRGGLMTTLKVAEDADGTILRLSNPTAEPVLTEIDTPGAVTRSRVRLDESPEAESEGPVGDTVLLRPFELLTLRLQGATRSSR